MQFIIVGGTKTRPKLYVCKELLRSNKSLINKKKHIRWGDCGPLIMFPIFVMIDYDISSRFSEELSYRKETNDVNQYIEMQCYESAY